ncbi:hypothetical protein IV203_025837 [Nitzschia inconspicua]|uniref:Uncharacterized protein n=1 Tax=Nitzschia inconspicua TaxID=303405 RepID=A0A9K3PWQ0_9STRA|nr:hypothetical protein IV203_017685 [Nitzschia inconspicua]KAG7362171.1 hypothetical protein IV203_025837 [Nitzschia inconspicua]
MAPYSNYQISPPDHPPFHHPAKVSVTSLPAVRSNSLDESSSFKPHGTPESASLPQRPVYSPSIMPNHEYDSNYRQVRNDLSEIIASQERAFQQIQLANSGESREITNRASVQQKFAPVRSSTLNTAEAKPAPLLLTEAIHPEKYKMKQKRRGATAVGIVSGAVVGTMVFPVLGTAIGGAAAGYACNKFSKHVERKAQRQWEKNSYQRQALESHTVDAVLV